MVIKGHGDRQGAATRPSEDMLCCCSWSLRSLRPSGLSEAESQRIGTVASPPLSLFLTRKSFPSKKGKSPPPKKKPSRGFCVLFAFGLPHFLAPAAPDL